MNKNEKDENTTVPNWMGKQYSFFSHKNCEYYPCHKGAKEEDFNCLFCYCPLYALGKDCGGNFRITAKGVKDCTNCMLPHKRKNYGYVTGKYQELMQRIQKFDEMDDK
ncbi:MAG: cysteine-rich small domain-containing protein [Eubacteriales bacterium]|nr:cysteine-rich small domain-containing protein [Eubacteriales bacterium]